MSLKVRDTTGVLQQVAGQSVVDNVLSNVSKNPISNKTVTNALQNKVEIATSNLVNYYLKSQTYTREEVNTLIGQISTMTIEVVAALPTQDISDTTIYWVGPDAETGLYDQYIHSNNTWIKTGDTSINLGDYVTKTELNLAIADFLTEDEIRQLFTDYYTISEVDDLLDAKQNVLTFDNVPTNLSSNPVKSGGVYSALGTKQDLLEYDASPTKNSEKMVKSGGIYTALESKQDVLTFDNVPTESSNNVVKSGGVYSAVDDVYKVIGENGAKNLLPNNTTSKTINGITYTVNDDGSVTANGTATANAEFILIQNTDDVTWFKNLIRDKTVTLSGCPSGGSATTYTLRKWGQSTSGTYYDKGNGVTFTADAESLDNNSWNFQIRVYNGVTVSNLTFYPMLRLASDTDSTYQPYAKTNQQLTEDKVEQAEVNDIVNVYGAKNLLPFNFSDIVVNNIEGTWSGNTYTRNGVSFTLNDDGSITANGTADASASTAALIYIMGKNAVRVKSPSNPIILSGCPSGGSEDGYSLATICGSASTGESTYPMKDYGEGVEISSDYFNLYVRVEKGSTVSNLTFYPMLRSASITDSTYQPYVETNKELSIENQSLIQQINENGAKNRWNIEEAHPVARNLGGTATYSNGTITVNCAATSYSGAYLNGAELRAYFSDLNGIPIILSYKVKGDSSFTASVGNTNSPKTLNLTTEYLYDEVLFNGAENIKSLIFYSKDASTQHTITITDFMCRLAIDKDSTYEPYAKTNQQLTESSVDWDIYSELGAVNMLPNNATTQTINGVTFTVNDDGTIEVSGTATANANLNIGSVNVKAGTRYTISDGIGTLEHDDKAGAMYATSNPAQGEAVWYWRTDYIGAPVDRRTAIANYDAVVTVYIRIPSGATVDYKFKPMFTIASYNGDYKPYAKSNKELTDELDHSYIFIGTEILTYTPTESETWASKLNNLYLLVADYLTSMPSNQRVQITNITLGSTQLKSCTSGILSTNMIDMDFVGNHIDVNANPLTVTSRYVFLTESKSKFVKNITTVSTGVSTITNESNTSNTTTVSARIEKYRRNF